MFIPTGTRNSILNTEARTVEAEVLSRRCVIMRLVDFSYEEYQKALRQSAGAVVIILPKNMSTVPQDIVQVIIHHSLTSVLGVQCNIQLNLIYMSIVWVAQKENYCSHLCFWCLLLCVAQISFIWNYKAVPSYHTQSSHRLIYCSKFVLLSCWSAPNQQ